jgi:predicted GNAT family acetyltransferase
MDTPSIEHLPERQRYSLIDDGTEIGFAAYRDSGEQRDFHHTEVQDAYTGRGLATRLIEFAVADARSEGKRIVGSCPMVAAWLGKHPELDEYVDQPSA